MKNVMHIRPMLVIILLGLACSMAQAAALNQPIQEDEREILFPSRNLIEFGRTAAEANCAGCHGIDGISDAEGKPHLAGQRPVYLYRVLKAFQSGERRDENNDHNAFLNEQALLSTAVYYASLDPVIVEQRSTEGEENSEQDEVPVDDPFFRIREPMAKCVKCHGETGNATRAGMPSLTAQDPEYFFTSMMSYVDGSRNHRLMGRLVGDLDEETIREMGVFYAVQEPVKTEHPGEGDANVGRRLAEPCESCHGADGNAKQASMPTLAGQDAKYFIKGMTHYKDGNRQHKKMFEAVEGLSEQDMIDMATYYANETPRRRDVRMPLKSAEWIVRCERCHGIDGNSSDPRYPMLAGQEEVYLATNIKSYATGEREATTMHAMTDPLSALDIQRIAAYFASQQPRAAVFMHLPCGNGQ
jgi:cytochrome c553